MIYRCSLETSFGTPDFSWQVPAGDMSTTSVYT
jgi:hypothetical protein